MYTHTAVRFHRDSRPQHWARISKSLAPSGEWDSARLFHPRLGVVCPVKPPVCPGYLILRIPQYSVRVSKYRKYLPAVEGIRTRLEPRPSPLSLRRVATDQPRKASSVDLFWSPWQPGLLLLRSSTAQRSSVLRSTYRPKSQGKPQRRTMAVWYLFRPSTAGSEAKRNGPSQGHGTSDQCDTN